MTRTFKEKRCCRCHKIYSATSDNFRRESRSLDGLTGACKDCLKMRDRNYRAKRKSKIAKDKIKILLLEARLRKLTPSSYSLFGRIKLQLRKFIGCLK